MTLQGKRIRCPDCSNVLTVTGAADQQTQPPAASQPASRKSVSSSGSVRKERPISRQERRKQRSPRRKPVRPVEVVDDDQEWVEEYSDTASGYSEAMYDSTRTRPTRQKKRSPGSGARKSKKKLSGAMIAIGSCLAAVIGLIIVVVIIAGLNGGADTSNLPDAAATTVPESVFPNRPATVQTFPSGVRLGSTRLKGSGPGMQTQMNIYEPAGEHGPSSIGCVLVAPAGTNLLIGNPLDGPSYHDETLPYAEAGFLAIQYSLDGPVRDLETASTAELKRAYGQFREAGAGTINTKCVIEFVKHSYPEVDPSRIYTAGHSSAGTVSLLAAEYLSDDVSACIAYAPCSDPEAFHSGVGGLLMSSIFPGMDGFDQKYSPVRNADKLKCPLFLFQATDDFVVDASETRHFAEVVRKNNSQVEYVEVPTGNHYDSMIQAGIPQAVQWLQRVDSTQ